MSESTKQNYLSATVRRCQAVFMGQRSIDVSQPTSGSYVNNIVVPYRIGSASGLLPKPPSDVQVPEFDSHAKAKFWAVLSVVEIGRCGITHPHKFRYCRKANTTAWHLAHLPWVPFIHKNYPQKNNRQKLHKLPDGIHRKLYKSRWA